jgi:O-antigen/teichoic acid export membrane protein
MPIPTIPHDPNLETQNPEAIPAPRQTTADPAAHALDNLAPPPQRTRLGRLKHLIGLDRAIAYTVLARGWSGCAGLLTVALIARNLSPAEQGFYYTFGSLVALQIIFELGFSVVILQLATHEVAHLEILPDGSIAGPHAQHSRLASVLRKAVKWYSVASVLMACVLIPAGWHFFATGPSAATGVHWRLPWICVVLASSITFQIDPIFSFLNGCGFVASVARTRLAQSILGGLLAWSALLLHHGLFSPALMICGQAIAGIVWILSHRRLLLGLARHPVGQHAIDWWKEVWPFQWRIAVSYACGFFIFQIFNPILFRFWGPAEAGRMGMSLSLSNAIGTIGIAWINTKAAPFGAMIARQEFATLDRVFFRSVLQTFILCVLGATVAWTGDVVMGHYHLPFAQRLLAPLPFAFLLISMTINQLVSSMALYLRAHKQEKFLVNSILGAICISLSAFFLGRRYGALGMTAGEFVIAIILGLGFGGYTFFKYRRLWHA